MFTSKAQEIELGVKVEIEILTIFYNTYVLTGQMFHEMGREPVSITFQKQGIFADMDYAIVIPTTEILGYVEAKERYISAGQFGDMVCPTRKEEYALRVNKPCYMVQRYLDGTYVLNLTQVKPFAVKPLQRHDWRERGDREVIPHNFYSLANAQRIY